MVVTLLASTCSTLAAAQAFEPLNFNAFANQRYDSNLFRLPDSVQPGGSGDRAVFSETFGAGIRFDKSYGLQRLVADLAVTRYLYTSYGNLDYTGNDASATYDWSLTPQLTGDVIIKHSNLPTDFAYAGFQISPNPAKSDLRRLDVDFRPGAAFHPRYSIFQSINRTSQPLFQQQSSRSTSSELSLIYEFRSGNTAEVYARRANGSYDGQFDQNPVTLADPQFKETEYGLRTKWIANGLSRLDANVGYLQRRHATFGARDFNGLVGSVNYRYTFTGKTSFEISASRAVGSAQTLFSNYVVDEGINLSTTYLATEKISLRPFFSYTRRTFEGSPFAGSDRLRQATRSGGVTANWSIRRNLSLSASVETGNRTSNNNAFQYRNRSAMIGGKFQF